ncbi:MAG: TrkH family potassium uptake protein [Rhodobacterales bacterium]|nr:TrkH family potassium uptake protein [Rhodobacterales bacterium]
MLSRLAELPLIVVLLGLTGGFALLPAIHALATDQTALGRSFFYSALIILIGTAMLGIATAAFTPRDPARSHLMALVGAYAILPLVMALPMLEAVPDTTLTNAWFEMVSAFTTTGATVYAAELTRFALRLFPVYTALTLMLWVLLLIAGDSGTNALILAMGTLSTSGIMGQGGLGTGSSGVPGEMLVFAFLIFAITRRALPGTGLAENRRPLGLDPELRLAAFILLAVTTLLFLRHWVLVDDGVIPVEDNLALASFWGVLFTSASFLTTTGYISADWQTGAIWTGMGFPGLLLLALAIIGGGTATTAGGVRLLRVYALLRHGERELQQIIHPNSVGGGGSDARRLRREGAQLAWVFFMLFAVSIAVTAALLTLAGVAFEPALVLTIAALTTTGPLAAVGGTDPIVYASLGDMVKAILGLAMIVGRLETLALLVLFLPDRGRS